METGGSRAPASLPWRLIVLQPSPRTAGPLFWTRRTGRYSRRGPCSRSDPAAPAADSPPLSHHRPRRSSTMGLPPRGAGRPPSSVPQPPVEFRSSQGRPSRPRRPQHLNPFLRSRDTPSLSLASSTAPNRSSPWMRRPASSAPPPESPRGSSARRPRPGPARSAAACRPRPTPRASFCLRWRPRRRSRRRNSSCCSWPATGARAGSTRRAPAPSTFFSPAAGSASRTWRCGPPRAAPPSRRRAAAWPRARPGARP
mmetsp:Transcript_1921/g.4427  ORF Transcript_1921/g.4427 Transcript_1921/m.4427 type:complete len:255 (+) Transcript_1921:40-804(+)